MRVENENDKEIIIIEVPESDEKPVLFRGRAYKRVGKSSPRISSSEIRKLVVESQKIYWDEKICEDATLDDIDWEFVENFFIKKYEKISKKEFKGNSKNLLLIIGSIKNKSPTNAGIILFGKEPKKFFKNSYIAIARYRGTSVGTERMDYREFKGNLFYQIDQCDKYIKEHINIMSRLHPMQVEREDIPEYPFFPIRELIVNSVSHRDHDDQGSKTIIKMFKDRIEYYNPGGLPDGVTPENIVKEQKSRNPSIVDGLMKIRYIEGLGEGWDRILDEFKNHPLKPAKPTIKDLKNAVLVTIFAATLDFIRRFKDQLNERQIGLLDYLKTHESIKSIEYAGLFEIKDRQARVDLSKLADMEIIIKEGMARQTIYKLNPAVSGKKRGTEYPK